ncbi:MAG: rod shape-determining protein MreC [Patescibacteria group bacterium]
MKPFKFSKKQFFLSLFLLAVFISFYYGGLLKPVEDAVSKSLNPITSKLYFWGISTKNFFYAGTEERDLQKENSELRKKVNELMAEKAELVSVKKENEKLREYLDFAKEREYEQKPAKIVSKGMFMETDKRNESILINKGAKDGLKKGMAAVNSQGVVTGKIAEVKSNVSEVRLLTNRNCELAVSIQNEEGTMGIARGEMGLTVNIDYIPQTRQISAGDTVVTSGMEENIPAGLILGKIKKVERESNDVWQTAVVEPLANLEELTMVAVVL